MDVRHELDAAEQALTDGHPMQALEHLSWLESRLEQLEGSADASDLSRLWLLRSLAYDRLGFNRESNLAFGRFEAFAGQAVSDEGADADSGVIEVPDRAVALLRQGQPRKAFEIMKAYDDGLGEDISAGRRAGSKLVLGIIAQGAARSVASEEAYRDALALTDDEDIVLPARLGLVHLYIGDWHLDQADEQLELLEPLVSARVDTLYDEMAALTVIRADLAMRRGRADQAELSYIAAVREAYLVGQDQTEAVARRGLAEVLRIRGRFSEARAELGEALKLSRSTEDQAELGVAIALIDMLEGEDDRAGRELATVRTDPTAGSEARARAGLFLALQAEAQGDTEQAQQMLEAALAEARRRFPYEEARIQEALGRLAMARDAAEARRRLARALVCYRRTGSAESPATLAYLAELDVRDGHLRRALARATNAVEILERERSSIRSPVHHIGFGDMRELAYRKSLAVLTEVAEQAAARGLISLARTARRDAFETLALMQARLAFEIGASRTPDGSIWTHLDPWEQAELEQADHQIDELQSTYDRLHGDASKGQGAEPDSSEADPAAAEGSGAYGQQLAGRIVAALETRRSLLERALLRASQGGGVSVPVGSLPEIAEALEGRRATLIDLVWQPDLRAAFVVTSSGQVEIRRIHDESVRAVDGALEVVRAMLDTTPMDSAVQEPAFEGAIETLREHWWLPLAGTICDDLDLCVVLDSGLAGVPVSAIAEANGRRSRVSSLPGPGLLLREVTPRSGQNKVLLAVGSDPARRLGGVLEDLRIASSVPDAVVIGDSEDPIRRLSDDTGAYNLLMISSHALSDDRPSAASIHLSTLDSDGRIAARDLSVLEVIRFGLRVNTVVLLACSGTSPSGGQEALSLAAALLAGARSQWVVATPYRQSDVGASLLWAELMPELVAGVDPAEALRAAVSRLHQISPRNWRSYIDRLADRVPDLAKWAGPELSGLEMRRPDSTTLLPLTDIVGWSLVG